MARVEKGGRTVPSWWPAAVAGVTMLCQAGATYATIGSRLGDAEKRLDVIEHDRVDKLRDYEQFKSDIRSDVAEMKTDLKWIRSALEAHGVTGQ